MHSGIFHDAVLGESPGEFLSKSNLVLFVFFAYLDVYLYCFTCFILLHLYCFYIFIVLWIYLFIGSQL